MLRIDRRNMRTLSVVIVHWNVPDLLRRCIETMQADVAHAGLDAEIIVVDCASDTTQHHAVLADYPDVLSLDLPTNPGYAAGCNAGFARSSGEAVLLLNPDIEVLPGALEALLRGLHAGSHVGLVAPLLLNTDGSIQSRGYRFPPAWSPLFDLLPLPDRLRESSLNGRLPLSDLHLPVAIDYPLGAALLLRRAALEQVGGLDETYGMYCEELDLSQRLRQAGWSCLLVPQAHLIHLGGQSTRQRAPQMTHALWHSRGRYSRRWRSRRDRMLEETCIRIGTTVNRLRNRTRGVGHDAHVDILRAYRDGLADR